MLWTLGEIWCVVSLSGLAFSALREMLVVLAVDFYTQQLSKEH